MNDLYIEKLEKENQTLNAERVDHLIELSYYRTEFVEKELNIAHNALEYIRKELVKIDKLNAYTEYIAQIGEINKKLDHVVEVMNRNSKIYKQQEKKEAYHGR